MLAQPDIGEADRIMETALSLGERRTWNAVHVYDIADEMHLGLAEVERHFRNKDEIAERWFRLADQAIASCANRPGWMALSVRERLASATRAWFQALEPHKGVTTEMLRYKVQPDHAHLVIQGVLRTSATVQWIREAARLPSKGLRRELEEPVLTAIFLTTLGMWLVERRAGTPRTWAWLDARLRNAERVALRLDSMGRRRWFRRLR
jgi:AcrR family transcriptional regulator